MLGGEWNAGPDFVRPRFFISPIDSIPARRTSNIQHPTSNIQHHTSSLYPTFHTVTMCSGDPGSRSSLRRSSPTWVSTVRLTTVSS